MDSFVALIIALVIVVGLAMAAAAYNNRAEDPAPRQDRQQKKNKKQDKKTKDVVPVKDAKASKKKKKAQPNVTFTWDGTVENDDESMIELLRGTSEHLAKEAKDQLKKKVQTAAATVGQAVEKVTGKGKGKKTEKEEQEEEFEYVLMKRKKVDDKTKGKKKSDKKENKEATAVAATATAVPAVEGQVVADPALEAQVNITDKKGKQKFFYKKGVFQSLREAANAEVKAKQDEDAEKEKNRGRKKDGKEEEATEPAKDERKDKPANPKPKKPPGTDKEGGAAPAEGDVNANQAVGPRQAQRPRREPREPKEPREAPPPPPRPVGGSFETASLDDMLSAISSHYGPKPKHNFSKLPPVVFGRLTKMLTLRDIVALTRVNNSLSKQCREDRIWRSLCERDFAIKVPRNQIPTNNKKKFRIVYRDEYLKSKGKPVPSK